MSYASESRPVGHLAACNRRCQLSGALAEIAGNALPSSRNAKTDRNRAKQYHPGFPTPQPKLRKWHFRVGTSVDSCASSALGNKVAAPMSPSGIGVSILLSAAYLAAPRETTEADFLNPTEV